MVELVEVAEARLDDAEELVAIRRQEALGLLAAERAERFLDRLDRRALYSAVELGHAGTPPSVAHFSTHSKMLLAASVVHLHRVSNGASAGAATLCDGQTPVAAASATSIEKYPGRPARKPPPQAHSGAPCNARVKFGLA